MKKLAIAALTATTALAAMSFPGTVFTENDRRSGDIQYKPGNKVYVVTAKKGNAQTEYPAADVVSLEIEKPANFDKLEDMVAKGQGAQAIAGLQAIVKAYRMMQWDKPACGLLVKAYLSDSVNQPQKAYDQASDIVKDDKTAAYKGDLAPYYWQALSRLGKTQQLENCLRLASTNGDRESSAYALVMRGDLILKEGGDTPDTYRQALTDAYLRVALMYNDPVCKQPRREALSKCAECFRKIGMDLRAENMEAMKGTL